VGPYCRATSPFSLRISAAFSAASALGKSSGAGSPPAKLMMPGRWVSLRSSRMVEAWIRSAPWPKSARHSRVFTLPVYA
jgi:hypothetical protein